MSVVVAALVVASLAANGCGRTDDALVRTDDPAKTFAPLVRLAPDERWMPMGGRWFLERSALWFAEDGGCPDRKVAVGRKLAVQRGGAIDWLFVRGMGVHAPQYTRTPYDDECELDFDAEFSTVQLTRPLQRRGRAPDVRLGEGFYVDLLNWARRGPEAGALDRTPAYVEPRPEEVDGEPGLRLKYWLLFGMGETSSGISHEGDWESMDVLLRGEDGEYEPVSVRFSAQSGAGRELAWAATERVSGGGSSSARTHPVVTAARGSHDLDYHSGVCRQCTLWRTWQRLERARSQLWYGFGGAWGEPGTSEASTGPLGPRPGESSPPPLPPEGALAMAGKPVRAHRPEAAFAPLIRFHSRERAFPIDARRFIQRSSLKWHDGRCMVLDDVATGRIADRKTAGRVPRLRPELLGRAGAYRRRALDARCGSPRRQAYSTADYTRPYDSGAARVPLAPDQGFYLDLLSDSHDGDPRFRHRHGRRLLEGVPAYHERRAITVEDRNGLRISYWMLYPHTEALDARRREVVRHEGGWERIEVILAADRRDHHWIPVAAIFHQADEPVRVPWRDVERAATADGPASHPVVYAARASHVPHRLPGFRRRSLIFAGRRASAVDRSEKCGTCVHWRTWERLQPARRQPWYQYGGGWGLAFDNDQQSGPLGPSPHRP